MHVPVVAAIQSAFLISGVLSLAVAGVELFIDRAAERYYIEVHPQHCRSTLADYALLAERVGYEIMEEWECPAEHLPGGAIRYWLAEKEVFSDSRSIQAV